MEKGIENSIHEGSTETKEEETVDNPNNAASAEAEPEKHNNQNVDIQDDDSQTGVLELFGKLFSQRNVNLTPWNFCLVETYFGIFNQVVRLDIPCEPKEPKWIILGVHGYVVTLKMRVVMMMKMMHG